MKIFKNFTNWYYKKFPPEMVTWWMHKEAVQAKVTTAPDGSYIMWLEGEKYPFPGFPRSHLLYGTLSPLKHEIKVQIFNDSWKKLDDGVSEEEVIRDIKGKVFDNIAELGRKSRHDMLPTERICPAIREFHRAWTKIANGNPKALILRDILCYIFQEDDAYRFRFQWLLPYLKPKDLVKSFEDGMGMMEHAEIVDDMKERVRLWKRILLVLFKDKQTHDFFQAFLAELDYNKVKLSKADKFFFRGKYFKVDYPQYEY